MRKIEDQYKHSKLLAGKALDSLNTQEQLKLKEWENKGKNKEVETSILNLEAFDSWSDKRERINTEEQWQRFLYTLQKSNIQNATKPKNDAKVQLFRAIASIAAVLIVTFSIYYTYQIAKPTQQSQELVKANIQPGTPQATLLLGNGQEVSLESATEKIIEEGNLSIENEKGVLAYNTTEKKIPETTINQLITPKGAEYQVVLPDGTKVWLNSDTKLTYSVPFNDSVRQVELKGEAYFDVATNVNKPFVVESGNQSIVVLGTEFNITCYSEDVNIVTTLVEGKVKVQQTIDKQRITEDYLLPNEQIVFNKETNLLTKQSVDVELYTAWKDGRFKFRNEPLESFLTKVARWYDVEIYITDESIKNLRFTGDLPRYNNMSDILNILEAEMSVHIDIKDDSVIYVSK
ncbi:MULTISPECIES: FecR family protein [unclassified Carboxylicivirga]|uniref:FecR family protein n=1 Tax=Carboxylicivirga TaxID=1628153 RepID=UPI003D348AAC